ncbi:MAG TPA: efflux RND transporter permease subunit [Longimicrobiales bacterium]|nr:efflux RND transporter permease subunit [Longimicrobiales bacterium]
MVRQVIRRPIAVSMLYMAVAALGFAAVRNIPVELLPDTSLPRLTVSASWPGASPEVTEAFLTAPLESAIQQVRGVERVTSTSREGSASIEVNFARDTDMDFARLELSERLASLETELPVGSRPPVVQMYVPDEFREQQQSVLSFTVTGPYLLEYLREYVEDHVVPELYQLDGVGAIMLDGGRARVLEVELDEARVQALGLRVQDVRSRIAQLEIVREAGRIRTAAGLDHTLAIRQRAESVADVRAMPLLSDGFRIVRVGDVARVWDTYEEPQRHFRIDGDPAVAMSIYREHRTNTVAMADRVRARVSELEGALPPGVRIILDRDQSVQIRAQLSDLRNRAAIAAVIVLGVLLLFLRSIRAATIVFATVAFAVLITLNIIYFGGLSLNLLTLMGLAMGFGLVVDNAIVVLENIFRRRRRGEAAHDAAEHGASEVMLPIVAATGTTVVVLIPFVYLQGELRIYYVPLAIVVGLSLVASLFVAFTFIPALGARLLGRVRPRDGLEPVAAAPPGGGPPLLPPIPQDSWPVRLYGGLIRGTLRFPWIALVLVAMTFGGSYYLFDKYVSRGRIWGGGGVGQSYISISVRLPRGEELARTDELTRYFEDRLRRMPEVDRFTTQVSTQGGSIRVTFPEELEHTSIPLAIKEQLYQYSLGYGGAEVRVQGFGPSFYGGGGSPPNYSIKILGYNYERVRDIAEDLGRRLQAYSRIREVDTNSAGSFFTRDRATELVLDIDRQRLAMHDVTAEDVVRQVSAAVRGRTQNQVMRVGGEEMQFSVKLAGYQDMDMHRLNELLIPAPAGEGVRLGDVATLTERNVLNAIIRENQQYQRMVSYEFRGPARLGDYIRDIVVDATDLPPGYTIERRQSWAWSQEERAQIYGVLLFSILLIFMVTASIFESLKQPLCVLLTVPMALIGVFLIFFYTGATFTREAYVGVIMMGGIVVNNSILLVDHVNQLRRRYGLALRDALERGTLERVRPILMTSLTTICGMLPLVLFSQTADANIWNALAYALIGGLSSSTILVLTITPALYLLFERRAEARRLARETSPEVSAAEVPATV